MSPQTWHNTNSRLPAAGDSTGGTAADAGASLRTRIASDGGRSSNGRSIDVALGVVASSTPGNVGWSRSPTVMMPIASRFSFGMYATARRRKM